MSKAVVILGAGASKEAGLPLLSQVFSDQQVRDFLHGDAQELLDFLKFQIWSPRSLTIEDAEDSLNIEEILTLLRGWERARTRPMPLEQIRRLIKLLYGCVQKGVYSKKGNNNARYYNEFVHWCDETFDETTWVSFNWDMKLEQAFFHQMKDLGEGLRLPSYVGNIQNWEGTNQKHLLLKLHGSVSWFLQESGYIRSYRFGNYGGKKEIDEIWDDYLRGATGEKPAIAEPSFFKHESLPTSPLESQWRELDSKLVDADVVFACGYSLPDGDLLTKQSILTSVASGASAPWTVVVPSSAENVVDKYRKLLGPENVTAVLKPFSEFVSSLSFP